MEQLCHLRIARVETNQVERSGYTMLTTIGATKPGGNLQNLNGIEYQANGMTSQKPQQAPEDTSAPSGDRGDAQNQ